MSRTRVHRVVDSAPHPQKSVTNVYLAPASNAIRVGTLLPNLCCGGVERYHEAIMAWTSPDIHWSGIAITSCAPTALSVLQNWSQRMPIYADPTVSYVTAENSGVNICHSEQAAIDRLLASSDILLTWGVPDLPRLISHRFRGPVITMSHGDGDWIRERLKTACLRATDYVAVSHTAARAFPRELTDKVVIQAAGVPLDRIAASRPRDEIRKEWGIFDDQIALGYIGRFSPEKNPLQVARIVGEMPLNYVAIYHGQNPWNEAEFRDEATILAKGRIKFLGPEHHTGDVYAGIDALIQASPAEGGPLVALEAWLTDTPLYTTPVGVLLDDKDGAAHSYMMDHNAPLSDWVDALSLGNISQFKYRFALDTMRRIAIPRYSAVAAARRWETYLKGLYVAHNQ